MVGCEIAWPVRTELLCVRLESISERGFYLGTRSIASWIEFCLYISGSAVAALPFENSVYLTSNA
jgi:hypothetical protein